jgi:hypothetical protein
MEKWAQQMNKKKETVAAAAAAAATKKPEPQKTPYKPEPFISTLKSGSDTQSSDVFKKSLEPSPANSNNNYKKVLKIIKKKHSLYVRNNHTQKKLLCVDLFLSWFLVEARIKLYL